MNGRYDFEMHFEQYRSRLHDELSLLYTNIAVYRRLNERKVDRLDEMNIAPAFFGVVMEALRSTIIVSIHRLFDENGEAGLWNYLTLVEYNWRKLSIAELKRRRNYPDGHWMLDREEVTPATINGHRAEIRSFSALQKIALHRDKIEAHSDRTYFFNPGKAHAEAPIMWSDLDRAIQLDLPGFFGPIVT